MKRMVRKSTKAAAHSRLRIPALERRRMETELRVAEEHIALSALDALATHIAILDGEGQILAVNKAWREFGGQQQPRDRGAVGSNYVLACDQADGASTLRKFADGVHSVLRGRRSEFS